MCYETIDRFGCGHEVATWSTYCKDPKDTKDSKNNKKKFGKDCPSYRFFRRIKSGEYCGNCSQTVQEKAAKEQAARANEELKKKKEREAKKKGKVEMKEPGTADTEVKKAPVRIPGPTKLADKGNGKAST